VIQNSNLHILLWMK